MRLPCLISTAVLALAASAPASAITYTFAATLSNVGEPVPTSTGTGTASVTFDDALLTVHVIEQFANLVNNANNAHIHCCTALANTGSAGVALGFTAFPAAQAGNYNNTFTLSAASFASLLSGTQAGKAYVNIHSAGTYAAGEIRGFLAPVPEPETYALMLAGLGMLGVAAKRRQRG